MFRTWFSRQLTKTSGRWLPAAAATTGRTFGVELMEDRLVPASLLYSLFPNTGPLTVNDQSGVAVATSGSVAVVGAWQDDTGATDAGAAYVYNAVTGALVVKLPNPTPAIDDRFGLSVAVSGNTVVVGAYQDDTTGTDSGAAYVFNATTGALIATLNNPTPAASDNFGWSVAISGNTVVVGAINDDTGAGDAGSAYVFDATTGGLIVTLNNPTPSGGDLFGSAVAISGNTVVVGAFKDDTGASDSGTAYLFNATTGALLTTINNPTPSSADWFGIAVAVSGNSIVVGARLDDTTGFDSGTAYLFDASSFGLIATLNNPAPATGDNFGAAVAVSGSTVVVGAYEHASASGTTYLFDAVTGAYVDTINNPTPGTGDWFGASVAVSGNTMVIGAWNDDTQNTDQGAAYIYSLAPVDTTAPTVTGVFFDGTAWAPAFRTAGGNNTYGYPAQTGSGQLTTMPWSTINTIYVKFSENIAVLGGFLGIRGINVASYNIGTFSYDSVNFVAKWTLAAPAFDTDWVILDLDASSGSAVADLAGNKLAGSWTESASTFPTTGSAGVNFKYRFKIAVGDADRNGLVRNADVNLVRANLFVDAGSGGYDIYRDIDGNGLVRNADVNIARSHLFVDPPSGPGPFRPGRRSSSSDVRRADVRLATSTYRQVADDSTRQRSEVMHRPVRQLSHDALDALFMQT